MFCRRFFRPLLIVLPLFVGCKWQTESESSDNAIRAVPTVDPNAKPYKITASTDTVLFNSSTTPGPFFRVDPANLCLILKGTEITIRGLPVQGGNYDRYAIAELVNPAPAADPSRSSFKTSVFSNKTEPCKYTKVWLTLEAWDGSPTEGITPANTGGDTGGSSAGGSGGSSSNSSAGGNSCCSFPVNFQARICYEAGGGIGAFGSGRDGGARKHAGCDIYGSVGNPIYAIDDGVVIDSAYEFYCDTQALEVKHGNRIVRYGEIQWGSARLSAGQSVSKGQVIAKIGQLSCYYQPMVHFEMFSGNSSGALTQRGNYPYQRRSDLLDPTQGLFQWRKFMPR